jgi:hypothetical protein
MKNIISASYNKVGSVNVVLEDMPEGSGICVPDFLPGQLEALKAPPAIPDNLLPEPGQVRPPPIPPPNMDRVALQEWEDAGGVIAPYEEPEAKPAEKTVEERLAALETKAGVAS